MKNYLIFILFLILRKTPAFAQVLFVDQNTKNPIAALNLYNKDGELIGFTDTPRNYTRTLERQSASAYL